MTIMAETVINHNWADPYSDEYRPEIIQLIEDVAANKVERSKEVWHINVEFEDIVSELYAHLLTKPALLTDNKFPSKILHNVASDYCFKQRTDQGATILGTDTLHGMLQDFNNLPSQIYKVLYGPVFAKAGKPAGTYLEIIEQEYKYKNKVVGASQRKTLARAVSRLVEVYSGIMVGTPESYEALIYSSNMPIYTMAETEETFEDPSFAPFIGLYHCSNKHQYRINTGAKPENRRIGLRTELGYYTCRCGEILYLDSREVVDEE